MLNKLLVVCGPTSTGKTKTAVSLAKKFNGEIISADSRQVYIGMNIGTGKDIPVGAKIKYPLFSKYGYYEIDGVKIWGYDLASPKHEFNVSEYLKFVNKIVQSIIKSGKLPILTGGTGLYIKAVIDGIPTAEIPKNKSLRKNLENKSADDLYDMLAQIDSIKAGAMNSSDRKNPRRLVRAIEVAMWKMEHVKKEKLIDNKKNNFDVLQIGLKAPEILLNYLISKRVNQRIKDGIIDEVSGLIKKGFGWNLSSMHALGYGEWKDYFEGKKTKDQVANDWAKEEKKYAKRQMIWFKKDARIHWFDVSDSRHVSGVEKMVKKWYNYRYAKEN